MLCAGLCGVAFWLGRATGKGETAEWKAELAELNQRLEGLASERPTGGGCVPQALDQAALGLLVERAVKDGMALLAPGKRDDAGLAARATGTTFEESEIAAERGRQILEGARGRREWTEVEDAAFREVLSHLNDEGRTRLVAEFYKSAKAEEFHVATMGPPL